MEFVLIQNFETTKETDLKSFCMVTKQGPCLHAQEVRLPPDEHLSLSHHLCNPNHENTEKKTKGS